MMPHAELRAPLSRRQAEIADLVVAGKSTREIALLLSLSQRTVETHLAAVFEKYDVNSRAELIVTVLNARGRRPLPTSVRTNLPQPRSPLVGREADIARIMGLLRGNRLVSIIGAGGIGKSRIALAIGAELLATTTAGVRLVELAALPAASAIVLTVARALGIDGLDDRSPPATLAARLKSAALLIVLDNCEHVVGEATALADAILRVCPNVRILATSREPLRTIGEQTYRLPSLRAPTRAESSGLDAAGAAAYAAIELFTSRARATDAHVELADADVPLVADICRRLDGIPLALELAAARVNVLSVRSLAEKLESLLPSLGGGDRLALPRHQTMRALIDWSYDTLSSPEQRLFACLSVFAGGCTLTQAAEVYDEQNDELGVLELLSSLVDKSLLVADLRTGEPRYELLQVFRPFAAEKLQSRGESSAALARHARAYTALAERLETEYDLAPTASWYPRATVEIENFTAALDWALENRHDVALGQRLAAALRPVWLTAGGGTHWRTLARELVDERTPALLAAQLDYNAAFAGYVSGEFDAALTISNRLSAVFLELGDPLRALYAQSLAAFILVFAGRLAEADPLIAAALDAARSFGRDVLVAFLLRAAAQASSLRGDSADCREKYAQALAIYEALGAERHINFMSVSLAEVEFAAGNAERAFALCATCLDRLRATDSPVALATALTNIAAYSIALDRWEHARAYAGEALTLAQATQDAQSIADAVQHLAAVAVLEPPAAAAPSTAERAAPAAQILGYVERYYAELGVLLDFTERLGFDRALRAVRAALAAAEVDRNMAEGAAMTAQQVISLASAL